MWESIVQALSSLFGGGAELGAAALEQAPQVAGAAAGAAGAGSDLASFYPWLMLGQLGLGAGMQAFGGGPEGVEMPMGEMPPNLMFGASPQQARARLAGASSDLQARGLYGASPDFMQKQLETDTGLTPTEFDQAFRTGGMRGGYA